VIDEYDAVFDNIYTFEKSTSQIDYLRKSQNEKYFSYLKERNSLNVKWFDFMKKY